MSASRRILIFSPHPDDVELFLGGTLLMHAEEGATIQIALMTKGEKGISAPSAKRKKDPNIRIKEAQERMKCIPNSEIVCLNFLDGDIAPTDDAIMLVKKHIEDWKPELIYAPEGERIFSFYSHSDHLATGQIVNYAIRYCAKFVPVRYYHSKNYNLIIDITKYFPESQRSLKYYKSQYQEHMHRALYLAWLARYVLTRYWGKKKAYRHAEVFREQKL